MHIHGRVLNKISSRVWKDIRVYPKLIITMLLPSAGIKSVIIQKNEMHVDWPRELQVSDKLEVALQQPNYTLSRT